MSELNCTQIAPALWELGDEGVNLYLIAGRDRAVLLDTGFGFWPDLRAYAERLCGLPVELVHTHAHGDHISGDDAWSEAWLHPAEWAGYRRERGETGIVLHPLEDGTVLELGGRRLEAVHVPGHSPGSTALLDRENRLLFSGDTVMTQPVFMMMPTCSLTDYAASLDRLTAMLGNYDTVYPSHQRWPLEPAPALAALRDCARRGLAGSREDMSEFELDLVVAVERFAGYEKDGFAIAMEQLSGSKIPAGQVLGYRNG